jgi:hypothetical protein
LGDSLGLEPSTGKKLTKPHVNKEARQWWFISIIPAMREAVGRRIMVPACPKQKQYKR